MVWSQYVYEATVDLDSYASGDDDDGHDITPLNIEDWEVEYSDELAMLWDTIRTLLYDAEIEHTGELCDFVELCYTEHDPYHERITFGCEEDTIWYEERLIHVWKNVRRIINDNGLHQEIMRGVTFDHFMYFAKNYMSIH